MSAPLHTSYFRTGKRARIFFGLWTFVALHLSVIFIFVGLTESGMIPFVIFGTILLVLAVIAAHEWIKLRSVTIADLTRYILTTFINVTILTGGILSVSLERIEPVLFLSVFPLLCVLPIRVLLLRLYR